MGDAVRRWQVQLLVLLYGYRGDGVGLLYGCRGDGVDRNNRSDQSGCKHGYWGYIAVVTQVWYKSSCVRL